MNPTTETSYNFDLLSYLKTELTQRCRANPAYSLRAFARDLGVEASALSKILNGKRAITPEMKTRFGRKLKLSREQLSALGTVPLPAARDSYQTLAQDSFRILGDWYHYAILELTKVDHFVSDVGWIARALGLTKAETADALDRLERLGFLSRSGDGAYLDVSGDVTTVGHEFTNIALKNMQRQVLQQALAALDGDFALRDQSSVTMAIDSSKLPQARAIAKKFRRDLSALLESGDTHDSVYQLSLSLFPLTKIPTSKSVPKKGNA